MIKKEPEVKIAIAWPAFKYAFENAFNQKIPVLTNPKDAQEYDLIIFSGGEDISPAFYGGEGNLSSGINPERDNFEYNVYDHCNTYNKKMLGVCRGHQLINALKGARFVQDLNFVEGLHHSNVHTLDNKQSKFIKHFTTVNSMHHQGISTGSGRLLFTSYHGRGKSGNYIVESAENDFIVTVQFHPEFMMNNESEEFFRLIKEWIKEKTRKISSKKSSKDEYEIFVEQMERNRRESVAERDEIERRQRENRLPEVQEEILSPDIMFNLTPEQRENFIDNLGNSTWSTNTWTPTITRTIEE